MPRIRDKMLQSGRMGSMLNGLGQEFDQTDWSGDYEPLTSGEWTGGAIYSDFIPDTPSSPNLTQNMPGSPAFSTPNLFTDLLNFGSKLLAPQPSGTQQQRITTISTQRAPLNMPLLVAAGLAAVFIISQKSRR